ncbi:hypothetical protein AcV5_008294 [Taiwanofungus camphoratus]|nr:hypothetical protein AcV5_008294 [Antrodia cinnamomea]
MGLHFVLTSMGPLVLSRYPLALQAFPTTRNFIPIAPRSQHLLDSTHSLTTSEEVTVWHPWWMPVKMAYHLDSIPYMLHWIASYGNLEDRAWGTQLSVSTVIHPL